MWEKLVELILGKAVDRLIEKKTPRKKLAGAFVDLVAALTSCHEAYLRAKASGTELDREEWKKSIICLAESIQALNILLEIHEPELLADLKRYYAFEAQAGAIHEFRGYAGGVSGPGILMIADTIYRDKKSEIKFDDLLPRVREFMRDQLKLSPEEILDT